MLAKIYFTGDHVTLSDGFVGRTLVCHPLS
ncbi:MAG: hypothetical protein ACI9VT_003243 [Psychroserpens sp.]|jgi:hypothetical protein